MIRRLYDLEDRLFYRSRTCDPAFQNVLETWSHRIGILADRLNGRGLHTRPVRRAARVTFSSLNPAAARP